MTQFFTVEDYMSRSFRGWGRVAGYTKAIRAGRQDQVWRYETATEPGTYYMIYGWRCDGVATGYNIVPGVDAHADGTDRLLAWIACYGDWQADEHGFLIIRLQDPDSANPNPWS